MNTSCLDYRIDGDNKIIHLSDNWMAFAEQNGAPGLNPESVKDKDLENFIADPQCRHIYSILLKQCRLSQSPLTFPFRCDSPQARRYLTMRMIPLEHDQVEFVSCQIKTEPRKPVALLAGDAHRSREFLAICSWCKKIRINDQYWLEAEEAIRKLDVFNGQDLPQLTHTICPSCYQEISKNF